MSRVALGRLCAAVVVVALAAVQCAAPTEIDVEIFSEVCDRGAQVGFEGGASLEALGTGAFSTTSVPGACDASTKRVGRVVLAPSGSDEAKVAFEIVTRADGGPPDTCTRASYRGCIVARRKLPFLRRSTVTMRVDLRADCVDVACSPDQTCVRGACVSADTTCEGTCDDAQLATTPVGAVPDASVPPESDAGTGTVEAGGPLTVLALAGGAKHSCAAWSDGLVTCWGDNTAGQVDPAKPRATRSAPSTFAPAAGQHVRVLAAGGNASCIVIDETNEIRCWGALGGADGAIASKAVPLAGEAGGMPLSIAALAMGGAHACALRSDGAVFCWGSDDAGQIGSGAYATEPVLRSNLSRTARIASGPTSVHTCVVSVQGGVSCWGTSVPGGGDPIPGAQSSLSGSGISALGVSDDGVCTVKDNTSCVNIQSQPFVSATTLAFAGLSAQICGLRDDGVVVCMSATPPSTTTTVFGAKLLATGGNHLCVRVGDKDVRCWGANDAGQVGVPATVPSTLVPVSVALGR